MRPLTRTILGVTAAAALAACGSDEPAETTGRPMAAAPEAIEAAAGENHPPTVERLSLRPRHPRPG